MERATRPSMHDARDAEDRRLLDEGNYKQLLVNYVTVIRERCWLRLRDAAAADDAAQTIALRLWSELNAGKRYPVPFRVVVRKVTDWELNGWYVPAKEDSTLPEGWGLPAEDAFEEWEEDFDIDVLFDGLPPGQREIVDLVYREGLSSGDAAQRLGINPNAVYQRLHNAHANLAERLRHGP